jgi:hypothetical protein
MTQYNSCLWIHFRDFEEIEEDVIKCFDEEFGSFQNYDAITLSRKKRNYVDKINHIAKSAPTPAHVFALVLKSHDLFMEKIEVCYH